MDPDQYEAVAASARKAVPPDEYLANQESDNEAETIQEQKPAPAPAPSAPEPAAPAPSIQVPGGGYKVDVEPDESYKTDAEIIRSSSDGSAANIDIPSGGYKVDVEPDETYMTDAEAIRYDKATPSREVPEYTYVEYPEDKQDAAPAPAPAPAPVSAADYTVQAQSHTAPEPKPAPAPVSAADYTVQAQSYTAPEPKPAPAPVSADQYTVSAQSYSTPEPAPAYEAPAPAPAPVSASDYTVQAQSYTAPEPAYTASSYQTPSYQESEPSNTYDDDDNMYNDLNRAPGPIVPKSTGSRRVASVVDIAPGDYEAVAASSLDDSDMDFADGSYDFDKFLRNAPTLQIQPAPAPAPAENDWADLGQQEEEPDITEEQTRELTAAIAQETLSNQPGTQFEDIIDKVIAKVLERKKKKELSQIVIILYF